MLVVSILAQKGGVGKSMLARSLAVQGLLDGRKTALIDADSQGTVTAWSKRRQLNVPAVVALGASTLAIILAELQRKGLISGKAVSRKRLDCTTIHHTSTPSGSILLVGILLLSQKTRAIEKSQLTISKLIMYY